LGITLVVTVPSPAARSGQLCSLPATLPACTRTSVTVSPAVQKSFGIFALPNGPIVGNGDLGVFTVAEQQIVTEFPF
jgi:hypothetical protein